MRKRLLAVFLMVLCVFCVCGCANVFYSDVVLSDGSIMQKIDVQINKTKLPTGTTLVGVHTDIASYATEYYDALVLKFKLNVENGNLPIEEQTVFIADVLGKTAFKTQVKQDVLTITLSFANIKTYKAFYSVAESSGSTETTDYWFYQTETQSATTEFHDIQNNLIAQQWLDYFKQKMPTCSFADCGYYYCYSTPHSQIHSDSDMIVQDEFGNYSHIWQFKSTDLTGTNAQTGDVISIYTIGIKTPLWYFVALGATALLIAGLYVWCFIKDKNKKKEIQVQIS